MLRRLNRPRDSVDVQPVMRARLCALLQLTALAAGCTMRNPAFVTPARRTGGGGEDARGSAPSPGSDVLGAVAPEVPSAAIDGAVTETGAGVASSPRVIITSSNGTAQYGDGSAAVGRSELCRDNEALIGYLGNTGTTDKGVPVVSSLQARCGRLEATSGPPYTIKVMATTSLGPAGGGASNAFDALCPADEVLVGFFGRAGTSVDQVGFRCSPLLVGKDAALTITLGTGRVFGPVPNTSGGDPFDEGCGTGAVAVGQFLNEGAWIDSLGLHCGRPHLAP